VKQKGSSKRIILLGAVLTAVGLALAGTAPVVGTASLERVQAQQGCGGAILLLGWVLLASGIHRFGRESSPASSDVPGMPRGQSD